MRYRKASWCVRHKCLTLLLSRALGPHLKQALESFRACEALSQRHPRDPSLPPKSAAKLLRLHTCACVGERERKSRQASKLEAANAASASRRT